MTGFLLLLAATVASMELVKLTGIMGVFASIAETGNRAMRVLTRTRVSEWAKERALKLVARRLFGLSLKGLGLLAIVAFPLVLAASVGRIAGLGVFRAWSSLTARVWLLILSTVYAVLRFRVRRRHRADEAPGERLLQRIALGNPAVLDMSFDLERRRYLDRALEKPRGAPVFVTGLARAGTTIILRALHESGEFAALTYRDLPFPLAPNHWADISHRLKRQVALKERSHGDGILHDLDSPEAIEEVFWRHHEGDRYIGERGLIPVAPKPSTLDAFAEYVRLVQLRYNRHRYLSKNNNNVLRLPALVSTLPDARLVHPFRDPLQQAASLLNQHWRARSLASDDPFRARFMGWMGHHEFGVDQRRFVFPGGPEGYEDSNSLDYWLKSWIAVYSHLIEMPMAVRRTQLFLDYDLLAAEGARMAPMLARALDLKTAPVLDQLRPPPPHAPAAVDTALLRRARDLHAALVERANLDLSPQEEEGRRA